MKKLIFVLTFFLAGNNLFAEEAGYIKFISSNGRVSLVTAEKSDKFTANSNKIPVEFNQVIRTDKDAYIKLYMFDGAHEIDIYPGTLYKINKPTKEKSTANLFLGKILFSINRSIKNVFGGEYEVKTKFSTMGVKGTSGFVVEGRKQTQFMIQTGSVEIKNHIIDSLPVPVAAGTKSTVDANKAPTAPEPYTQEDIQQAAQVETPVQQTGGDSASQEEQQLTEEDKIGISQEQLDKIEEISDVLNKINADSDSTQEQVDEYTEVLIKINLH